MTAAETHDQHRDNQSRGIAIGRVKGVHADLGRDVCSAARPVPRAAARATALRVQCPVTVHARLGHPHGGTLRGDHPLMPDSGVSAPPPVRRASQSSAAHADRRIGTQSTAHASFHARASCWASTGPSVTIIEWLRLRTYGWMVRMSRVSTVMQGRS